MEFALGCGRRGGATGGGLASHLLHWRRERSLIVIAGASGKERAGRWSSSGCYWASGRQRALGSSTGTGVCLRQPVAVRLLQGGTRARAGRRRFCRGIGRDDLHLRRHSGAGRHRRVDVESRKYALSQAIAKPGLVKGLLVLSHRRGPRRRSRRSRCPSPRLPSARERGPWLFPPIGKYLDQQARG